MSHCEIIFSDVAANDISLAVDYLIDLAKNLNTAKKLIANIQKTIEQIKAFPCSFPISNDPELEAKEIRCARVGAYVLFYKVLQGLDRVSIVSFLHGKRDFASALANRY